MEPNHSIKSSFSYNGVSAQKDQQAFSDYQQILSLLAEVSARSAEVAFDLKMVVGSSSGHPPLPASPPPELTEVCDEERSCDICGEVPPWREVDTERGICSTCAEHMDDSLKYYTEEFAHASAHGKDALSLLVLRQRADNCRDFIAAAAASYDGDLEAHEASVEQKMLNERAAECLARLPASFAPWWKDTWTHEKWCQIEWARETTGWAVVSKNAPIVPRLAAMFLTEQATVRQMKKAHAEELQAVEERLKGEMEAKHAEVVANIQQARIEDMDAVEGLHAREMAPLIGISDTMRAECEKKCHNARRKGYAMGYAFADEKATKAFQAMRADLGEQRAKNKELLKKHDALLELVEPTVKLMKSNPELFGGEARGTSSPMPPPIIHLKGEGKEEALTFLESLVASSRPCPLVESTPTVLPKIVEVEPPMQGECMALTKGQYQEMVIASAPLSSPPSPLLVPDQPTVCGAAGCYECPAAEPKAKPKPKYNHSFWPSPRTKRFARHIAANSGKIEPKTIKTHEDALQFLAQRANISVEYLLTIDLKTYQERYARWSIYGGGGTSPFYLQMCRGFRAWWC